MKGMYMDYSLCSRSSDGHSQPLDLRSKLTNGHSKAFAFLCNRLQEVLQQAKKDYIYNLEQ